MAVVIGFLSVLIALSAVAVAVWQVDQSAKNVKKSNSLPALSEVSQEWRSPELRASCVRLLAGLDGRPADGGFDGLPDDLRDSAYEWSFFCEYLGMLIASDLVPEELIISFMGTQIMQVWHALTPHILSERRLRAGTLEPDTPADFLPHYEHLVARIVELGGRSATPRLRRRIGIRALGWPLEEKPIS